LKFIVNSQAVGVKAFERGVATQAQVEAEFQKHKMGFTLSSLGGQIPNVQVPAVQVPK